MESFLSCRDYTSCLGSGERVLARVCVLECVVVVWYGRLKIDQQFQNVLSNISSLLLPSRLMWEEWRSNKLEF